MGTPRQLSDRLPIRPLNSACVLYIGIPAHNEATTIGVLLWRLRSVLADVSREYEVVVYDDASTDQTAETLAPYTRVLPLTVLRGPKQVGYGGAVDAIARHVAKTTRYPRRDALLLLQGDFTDPPAMVPEFLRRFEGGADLILGERTLPDDAPQQVRRLCQAARWVLRPFVGITDVRDLTSSYRLVRIAVLRDLIKASADSPISAGDFWDANVDFALRAAALARRVETIPVTPTFQVRTRESRRTAWPDAIALAKWAWRRRGDRVAVRVIARTVEVAEPVAEEPPDAEPTERSASERRERTGRPERPARPERKQRRERSARSSTEDGAAPRQRTAGGRRAKPESGPDGTRSGETGEETASDALAVTGASAASGGEGEASGSEEPRSRRARPRRRRGGRKDRPGDDSREEGTRDEPAASAPAGEAGDSIRAASPSASGERGAADSGAEAGSDGSSGPGSRTDGTDGDDSAEGSAATPRKRKRSRRGRRKRADGEAPMAGASSENEGDSSTDRSDEGGSRERSEPSFSDATRDGDAPDGSDGSASTGAPKRRRSRRGRRGGARRRDGDAETRHGQSADGGAEPETRRSEPEPRGETD